jgi:hypothetical protein
MSNIQKTLDSLQPYVIGIRYVEGSPLVDAVFKEGWTVPDDPKIKKMKGNDEMNYYMIYSDVNGIGLDELLDFVDRTIKLNVEREKKHELLRSTVNTLKEVFKKHPLNKLKTLKFTFSDEDLIPNLNDFDIDSDFNLHDELTPSSSKPEKVVQEIEDEIIEEEFIEEPIIPVEHAAFLDENGQPIPPTEEELELLAEEARAEKNRKYLESKKANPKIKGKVELPPKKRVEMPAVQYDYSNDYSDCGCGPDEACDKCIDNKY